MLSPKTERVDKRILKHAVRMNLSFDICMAKIEYSDPISGAYLKKMNRGFNQVISSKAIDV